MSTASFRLARLARARLKLLSSAQKLQARYESLVTRERLLVVVTGLALGASAWDFAINQPTTVTRAQQATELQRLRNDVQAQRGLAATLRRDGGRAEVDALHAAVAKGQADLEEVERRLQSRVAGFVPPDKAEQMLADVLTHYPGLSLVSAEVLEAEPLTMKASLEEVPTAGEVAAASATTSRLYKHAMRLELAGNDLDSLAYLRELEQLPWGLAWDRVDFQVGTHPNGRLVIEMHTISDRKEWVGA